ncbi:MAG: ABC transporter permease, partial [bacterium]
VHRELTGLTHTGVGWIVGALLLFLASLSFFFLGDFLETGRASLDAYFESWPALFSFLLPALTMRVFAEERSNGMDELLGVFPVASSSVVIGKFAALMVYILCIAVLSLPVPLGVGLLGRIPVTLVLAQYVSLFMLASAMLSIGVFVSAITASQIVAYVFTVLVLIVLAFLDSLPGLLGLGGTLAAITRGISLEAGYTDLAMGLMNVGDITYFVMITVLFLRAATHALKARGY